MKGPIFLVVESVPAAACDRTAMLTAKGSGRVGVDDGRRYAAFVAEHSDNVVRTQEEINGCRQR